MWTHDFDTAHGLRLTVSKQCSYRVYSTTLNLPPKENKESKSSSSVLSTRPGCARSIEFNIQMINIRTTLKRQLVVSFSSIHLRLPSARNPPYPAPLHTRPCHTALLAIDICRLHGMFEHCRAHFQGVVFILQLPILLQINMWDRYLF